MLKELWALKVLEWNFFINHWQVILVLLAAVYVLAYYAQKIKKG